MSRPLGFAGRKKRLKRLINEGNISAFLQELMTIGVEANELEDYKMSPRNLFEMAELLTKIKKLEAKGALTDDRDSWLRVIEGGEA